MEPERYTIRIELTVAAADRPGFTLGRAQRVAKLLRSYAGRLRHVTGVASVTLDPWTVEGSDPQTIPEAASADAPEHRSECIASGPILNGCAYCASRDRSEAL